MKSSIHVIVDLETAYTIIKSNPISNWNKFSTQFYKTKWNTHGQKVSWLQSRSPCQLRGEQPPRFGGLLADRFLPNLNLTLKS